MHPGERDDISAAVREQAGVVINAELRTNFEKLKLGAMVSEAVRLLRLDGAAMTGPNAKGGGAKGWWAEVCPKSSNGDAAIPYKTVMMWRCAAENVPQIMGVGIKKRAEVIELLASDPAEAVGKDAKILEKAEKVTNGLTMRQMLFWDDGEPRKAGRPVGTGHPIEINRNAVENAALLWAKPVRIFAQSRAAFAAAAKLLPLERAQEALAELTAMTDALEARIKKG